MRQGQQNRRGRGPNNSNNNNNNTTTSTPSNNRKPQNPLSRNYESSGPDVKIRGTAAQIAEKYITLARDAASSGDSVMSENYLQHAEHYNRIIMAAQAQAATVSQHSGENGYAMNGAQRHGPDTNGALREQPHMQPQPQAMQPHPQSAPQPTIPDPAPQQQPAAEAQGFPDMPEFLQTPVREPKKETAKEAAKEPAEGETDGRRRRRRYTSTAANGTSRTAAAEGTAANGNGKTIEVQGEDRSSDEALI
jgi:hypothetical protein